VGAVRELLAGRSGVMVTRQESAIVPIPFESFMDPETGRTAVRLVDTSTESHECAHSLQIRLESGDLEDPEKLEQLCAVTGLDAAQTRERYRAAI